MVGLLLPECATVAAFVEEPDNRLNGETLKKIQAGIAELRNGQADIGQDIRDVNAMILGMIGELVKSAARDDDRFARLEARVEDIEQRLDRPPSG
jgi:hypothetical protein